MSKQTIRKFRKSDFEFDDDNQTDKRNFSFNKKKEKRVERALRTKDIGALLDDEDEHYDKYHWPVSNEQVE